MRVLDWRILTPVSVAIVLAGVIYLGRFIRPQTRESEPHRPEQVTIDNSRLAEAGFTFANQFTGPVHDSNSLEELQSAIERRGPEALLALQRQLHDAEQQSVRDDRELAQLNYKIGTIHMYLGELAAAATDLESALALHEKLGTSMSERAHLLAVQGVISLRQGEIDNCINCVGPSSCILPIARSAVHADQTCSRKAAELFTRYLQIVPTDLRVRWLLNLAYMTLGEYPEKVPRQFFVPLDTMQSEVDVGRFTNVAPLVGLTAHGPNQAGGSIFDDFTGDGRPDLFVTSLDVDRGAALYVNQGNGRFEIQSEGTGLTDQIYVLNLTHADFDNDGYLDVLLLRGGWEQPMRMSLLRNTGNCTFEDVTLGSGLGEPIASESAVWGDYDNDGLVDLFVCGEYFPPTSLGGQVTTDPRNCCRLYHNEGQGKFIDVAEAAGVTNRFCAKGSAWGDYDGDGRLDLFVSNMNGPCRLYHNEGNGTFRDVAAELGLKGPAHAFACWFWDYNNDGRLDLYVNDYTSSLAEFVAESLQATFDRSGRPCLFENRGTQGFQDVTRDVGLDREFMPMGCNFADIDNDGYPDFYLGTGRMALEALVPNLMFKNLAGRRFADITFSSGTGHLQKGHGVSFADWDGDGDLDLFVVAGGAVPGDRSYNMLFENPGHGNHWLKVKLVGTRSNRAALGAQITAVVTASDGTRRSIHRTIGNNGSFGGNTLVQTIGLSTDTRVTELWVFWPASQTVQAFHDLTADQTFEITEGESHINQLSRPWQAAAQRARGAASASSLAPVGSGDED